MHPIAYTQNACAPGPAGGAPTAAARGRSSSSKCSAASRCSSASMPSASARRPTAWPAASVVQPARSASTAARWRTPSPPTPCSPAIDCAWLRPAAAATATRASVRRRLPNAIAQRVTCHEARTRADPCRRAFTCRRPSFPRSCAVTQLVIEDLQKIYQDRETHKNVHAIRGINPPTGSGELVSLLGPSGCGKTTTLRCIAGFETPDAGAIRFDGENLVQRPPEQRDIGLVFQNYALFPHMTVGENISFGLEMRRVEKTEIRRRVSDVLDMVQLTRLEDRYPRQLSGGQQQRVALARALVIEPRVLLLDEPLANLDAKLRDEMRFFIRSLQQRVGITTLYVTHDQSESMVMSDRIVVMFGGRIHQIGGPEDIYYRPASREAASFIGQANLIEGSVITAEDGVALIEGAAGRFRCGTGTVVTAGEKVTAMVRPEALQMCDSADQADFHGRIVTTHFL